MPLDIAIEDERGRRARIFDGPTSSLASLLPEANDPTFRCVGFIDPYGNTIFNQLQLPVLIAELEELSKRADVEQRATIDRLLEFASGILETPHWYLRFIGD